MGGTGGPTRKEKPRRVASDEWGGRMPRRCGRDRGAGTSATATQTRAAVDGGGGGDDRAAQTTAARRERTAETGTRRGDQRGHRRGSGRRHGAGMGTGRVGTATPAAAAAAPTPRTPGAAKGGRARSRGRRAASAHAAIAAWRRHTPVRGAHPRQRKKKTGKWRAAKTVGPPKTGARWGGGSARAARCLGGATPLLGGCHAAAWAVPRRGRGPPTGPCGSPRRPPTH